nr:MAG TPA: hypothetical protein [Microviridae sp.]
MIKIKQYPGAAFRSRPRTPIGTASRLTNQPLTAAKSRGRRFALKRSKVCARIRARRRARTHAHIFINLL